MKALTFLALATTSSAQGFLHLDLGRRSVSNADVRRRSSSSPSEISLYQNGKFEYVMNVTIGTPGQTMGVTLDTGSSDLWVPTPTMCGSIDCDLGSFDPGSSTSYNVVLEGEFNITYTGPGDSDVGDWASDVVSVGAGNSIANQIFGACTNGADEHGILGIGYDFNEAKPNPKGENGFYHNVMDNLVSQEIISRKAYSIYLNSLNETKGSLLLGGVDSAKYMGPLVALPLQTSTDEDRVTEFYVTLTSVVFNDAVGTSHKLTPDEYATSVLLDTGTSRTFLDADTVTRLGLGLGAVSDDDDFYLVPCEYANSNATVSYTFGGSDGVTITVPLSELVGQTDKNLCVLGYGGPIGGGGSAILGDTFLRSAYAVFDLDNNQAALAQAIDNRVDTSSIVAIPSGTAIPGASITATATGTQLDSEQATAIPSIPVVKRQHNTYSVGTPTFSLGAAATSDISAPSSSSGPSSSPTPKNAAPMTSPDFGILILFGSILVGVALR